MSDPGHWHLTSEPTDYYSNVPTPQSGTTDPSRATTRRRPASRRLNFTQRRRLRRYDSWIPNATYSYDNGANGTPQEEVFHQSDSSEHESHPIGDSELLHLPTTANNYLERPSTRFSTSTLESIPFPSAPGQVSHAMDQLDSHETPISSLRGRHSPELNLNEASNRLQQANTDLRLLLEQPFGSEPLQRSSTDTTRTHTLPTGRQDSVSRRRFWYGLARPAASESSRTWGSQGRRRANYTASPAEESEEEDSAAQAPRKRQKLHDRPLSTGHQSNQYGWYGQVVPAKLDLQLLSSDGGIVDCPLTDAATTSYGAENVLKDDSSVYCTKASRCNILLQHRNKSMFTLDTIVIRAPRSGFTDPVHEGLVFVAMRNDRVLEWTTKYPICYLPTSLFAPYFPSLANNTDFNSSEVELAHEPPSTSTSTDHVNKVPRPNSSVIQTSEQLLDTNDEGVRNLTVESSEATNPTPRAESSDSRRVLEARLQALARETRRLELIRNRVGPDWHPEEAEELTRLTMHISNRIREIGQAITNDDISRPISTTATNASHVTRNLTADHPTLHESGSDLRPAPRDPLPRDSSFEHISPVARFRMRQQQELVSDSFRNDRSYLNSLESSNNSSITIKFDPPLSARYILVKLWSPRHGGNIDIQNISAQGYVGPRFFPAMDTR